jgi:phosphoglycerol transferase MdoB-like AlkP superfamily enzyme
MFNNKHLNISLLLFVTFIPSIICFFLKNWFSIDRPIFFYDYFIISLLIVIRAPILIIWGLFTVLFILDLTLVFSKFYLFNLSDFIDSFNFIFNYSFNFNQLIFILFFGFILFGIFVIIKKLIKLNALKLNSFYILFTFILLTVAFDIINGTTFIFPNTNYSRFYKGNFAGSICLNYYKGYKNKFLEVNTPHILNINNQSITFSEFSKDSSTNQLIIIVESFGFMNNLKLRNKFQNSLSAIFINKGWKSKWGSSEFNGGTTKAELRELVNVDGEYGYFLNKLNASKYVSIFKIKKQQGYKLAAIHSFTSNMFQRSIWWKNIGIDNFYFLGDLQLVSNFKSELNYDTPFGSLRDEDSFDYIQKITPSTGKQFVYMLTENTHLPFLGKISKPIFSNNFNIDKENYLSDEAKNQNKRLSNFFVYLANHIDYKKFQRVIFIGDHMPPFLNNADRKFYNNKLVPYCILTSAK